MNVDNQRRPWIKSGYKFSAQFLCGQFVDKCFAKPLRPAISLLVYISLFAVTALLTASSIKPSWVVPGGTVSAVPGVLGSKTDKFCVLTFDDGPDEIYTAQVQTILDFYGVKATFFVVGNQAEERLEQVVALDDAGHEIANHSYTHADFAMLSSVNRSKEMVKLNDLLKTIGITPKWFRPPYGAYNKTTVNIAAKHDLETVLWTLDPKDWTTPGTDLIRQRVLTQTSSGEVILLHSTNPQTVEALPGIINGLRNKGFKFVTLGQWREILTGKFSVPPARAPYPNELAAEKHPTKSILMQSSVATQALLPEHLRRSIEKSSQSAPSFEVLTVYSNFQNPEDCNELHSTKSSKGNFIYYYPVTDITGFFEPIELEQPVDEPSTQWLDLYYHWANEPRADKHDTP